MIDQEKEHLEYIQNVNLKKRMIVITRVIILIAFFSLWEISGDLKWVDPFLTSTPSRMWISFLKIYSEGTLFLHIGVTCYETIVGFIVSTIIGTIIAVLLWWSDFASKVMDPYLVVLNSVPKIALAPIIIFWVGNGMRAIVLVAILISVIVTIITVLSGFKAVDNDKVRLLQTFGATKFQVLTNLVIPATIPTLISALKINVGLCWVGVIMGEFLVAKNGLGFLIIYGGQTADLDMVMMSIIVLAILSYLMYECVAIFEKKLMNKLQL